MQQAVQVVQTTTERSYGRVAAPRVAALVVLAMLALTIQACREDEQNRPWTYDKGTYQGPVHEPLGQDQLDALRQRAAGQRM